MKWFVIYTKPGCAKQVADKLTHKKISNYSPTNRVVTNFSKREKSFEEPLLPGYVFVRLAEPKHKELMQVNGIINFVFWLKEPVVIEDMEVMLLQQFLSDHVNVSLKKITPSFNEVKNYDDIAIDRLTLSADKSETANLVLSSLGYIITAKADSTKASIIAAENVIQPNVMHTTILNTA